MNSGPLSGIRVLDLTNVLAGPYCSYQLLLFGAEVIKVEMPKNGDLARQLGADPQLNSERLGASFLAQNAGKKSIELDLKDPSGKDEFRQLVKNADVVIENFRPGVMQRLGFGWETLHQLNSKLIYCAISGFGQNGPMSNRPAYDQIIQGLAGIMSVTGTEELAPLRAGFPVCDTIGGLGAAMAISAALAGRANSGQGCFLDVSMLETSVSAMGWAVSNYLITGEPPSPMGNDNATAAPSGAFPTASGLLNIAANKQEQFEILSNAIGMPELLSDERFKNSEMRKLNREIINQEIAKGLSKKPAAEWEETLSSLGVPAARVLSVPEMVQLEQLKYRKFFTELPFPNHPEKTLTVSGNGIWIDGEPLSATAPPPTLGQHNQEIFESQLTETATGCQQKEVR